MSDNLTRARHKKRIVINQLALFSPEEEELGARLRELDVDSIPPIEALRILAELKDRADKA